MFCDKPHDWFVAEHCLSPNVAKIAEIFSALLLLLAHFGVFVIPFFRMHTV